MSCNCCENTEQTTTFVVDPDPNASGDLGRNFTYITGPAPTPTEIDIPTAVSGLSAEIKGDYHTALYQYSAKKINIYRWVASSWQYLYTLDDTSSTLQEVFDESFLQNGTVSAVTADGMTLSGDPAAAFAVFTVNLFKNITLVAEGNNTRLAMNDNIALLESGDARIRVLTNGDAIVDCIRFDVESEEEITIETTQNAKNITLHAAGTNSRVIVKTEDENVTYNFNNTNFRIDVFYAPSVDNMRFSFGSDGLFAFLQSVIDGDAENGDVLGLVNKATGRVDYIQKTKLSYITGTGSTSFPSPAQLNNIPPRIGDKAEIYYPALNVLQKWEQTGIIGNDGWELFVSITTL